MKKDKLLIMGAGGHGKVVADVAIQMDRWEEISFLDNNLDLTEVLELPVIDVIEKLDKYVESHEIFIAIGDNKIRKELFQQLILKKATIPTLIHPSAVIGTDVSIKRGTVVMAGVVINSSVAIDEGSIINTSATIDHDCYIHKFVHISPGVHIAGNVTIYAETWVGIGSVIKNNLTIAKNVIIGAGAVVVRAIEKSGTYIGIPARRVY